MQQPQEAANGISKERTGQGSHVARARTRTGRRACMHMIHGVGLVRGGGGPGQQTTRTFLKFSYCTTSAHAAAGRWG